MAVIRSEKKPVTTTRALSPGSTRLAAATSMARVPLPARMNGWPDGPERQTSRIRSIDGPKDSIRRGEGSPGRGGAAPRGGGRRGEGGRGELDGAGDHEEGGGGGHGAVW